MFCHPYRSFNGKHFPMYCHEHITDHAIIEVSQGQEFQNGGDTKGRVIRTEYQMSPMQLGLVNLTELRKQLSSR